MTSYYYERWMTQNIHQMLFILIKYFLNHSPHSTFIYDLQDLPFPLRIHNILHIDFKFFFIIPGGVTVHNTISPTIKFFSIILNNFLLKLKTHNSSPRKMIYGKRVGAATREIISIQLKRTIWPRKREMI